MVDLNHGSFVISLDFEMMWGGLEIWSPDGYGKTNVANVRTVFERLLALLDKYDVKATVATVGLIMQADKVQAANDKPSALPTYDNPALSAYGYVDGIDNEMLYFAPDIIAKLKACRNVEIGTHTYSHYYCWESGQTPEQFEQDILKAKEVAERNGIELKSIVFPRNEVSDPYLEICGKYGIEFYRGNASKFFNQPKSSVHRGVLRACRLIDTFVPFGKRTSYNFDYVQESPITNVPASRFFRPYSQKFSFAEGLKINRICGEIKVAAKHNEVYHLWFHPHNVGANIDENLRALEKVFQHFSKCREIYSMQSVFMGEFQHSIAR